MPAIDAVPPSKARGKVKEIYSDIKGHMMAVPLAFRVLGVRAEILEAVWLEFKASMLEGELPREAKEMMAVIESQANGCSYCVGVHTMFLRVMGLREDQITALHNKIESVEIDDKLKALLLFARKAIDRERTLSAEDVEELRAAGYSDGQIIEAAVVLGNFAFVNRLVEALDVEEDLPVMLSKNRFLAAFTLPIMRRKMRIS